MALPMVAAARVMARHMQSRRRASSGTSSMADGNMPWGPAAGSAQTQASWSAGWLWVTSMRRQARGRDDAAPINDDAARGVAAHFVRLGDVGGGAVPAIAPPVGEAGFTTTGQDGIDPRLPRGLRGEGEPRRVDRRVGEGGGWGWHRAPWLRVRRLGRRGPVASGRGRRPPGGGGPRRRRRRGQRRAGRTRRRNARCWR